VGSKGAHHGRRQIMLSVHAAGIAARDEEKRRSLFDHDAPNVRVPPDAGAILDVQPKADHSPGASLESFNPAHFYGF
jgi:hypothetical protein